MHTIAMVTQKGGSGKTTLAICLAAAAREAGERVFLIDLDPQRSLSRWRHQRDSHDIPVEAIAIENLQAALAILARRKVTLVIIDTPASDTPVSDAAIEAASLCLIPVRPAIFDIWASELTRQKLKIAGTPFAFILNQCTTAQHSKRALDGAAALETMGGVLRPFITSRIVYQEAMQQGLGPTEHDPSGKAADEIRLLWASLSNRLRKLDAQRFSFWDRLGALL